MNRKVIAFNVSMIMLLGLVGVFCEISQPAEALTLFVDDDGLGNYLTIQEAIEAAKDGDTIYVHSGLYYGIVVINKELTLVGENRSTTIIDGNFYQSVIVLNSGDITIRNFTIRNSQYNYSYSGIITHTDPCDNLLIEDNIFFNNLWGIRYVHGSNGIIRNNVFSNNYCGVRLDYDGNTIVEDNIFLDNAADGIFIAGGFNYNNNFTVVSNIFIGNGWDHSISAGVRASGNNHTIADNYIYGNRKGVCLHMSNDIVVRDNVIKSNDIGIHLYRGPYNPYNSIIYHNNIIDNTVQALDELKGYNNWYNTDLLEGNYWSDYTGLDDGSGEGKHAIAGDGIGDTEIPHPETGYDFYPFINENGWDEFPNQPPVADAGPDQTVYVGTTVFFDGSNSSDPDGDIVSYEWDFGDGTLPVTDMMVTHVFTTPGVYMVTLTVTDSAGNSDSDTCEITVFYPPGHPPLETDIILEEGWNLISLPTIQTDTDIQAVLQSIQGDYDAIQVYDAMDTDDPWKHNNVYKPYFFNDLSTLDNKMGIMIHVINPEGVILLPEGEIPTVPQEIQLRKGWNLVGYPSSTSRSRTVALGNLVFGVEVDSVWTLETQTQIWEEMEENGSFEIGKGYWIHAKEDCVWVIPLGETT